MSEYVSPMHFQDLESLDPEDVKKRTGCDYNPDTRCYRIIVWGYNYVVDMEKKKVYPESSDRDRYNDYLDLFILQYLMKAKDIEISGDWVSEKDLKGGAAFFRGPHLLPVEHIVKKFGDDLNEFSQACRNLGGTPVDFADAAFSFDITPKIPVAILYWQGDEDFPSEAKMLFDRTIEEHLALDIVFALAVEVVFALAASPRHES